MKIMDKKKRLRNISNGLVIREGANEKTKINAN